MDVIAYAVAIIVVVIMAGIGVAALLSSSARAGKKRKEELPTRYVARQPWDAQSANGRGNR